VGPTTSFNLTQRSQPAEDLRAFEVHPSCHRRRLPNGDAGVQRDLSAPITPDPTVTPTEFFDLTDYLERLVADAGFALDSSTSRVCIRRRRLW
jgi:hypothetical protein